MAGEFTLNGSVAYSDGEDTDFTLGLADVSANITTKKFVHNKVSVGTSEEALPLAEVTVAGGLAIVINRDATNYVELRSATGAANDVIRVNAGEFAVFRWGSDVTAPYAIANTAAVPLEYCFWSA